MTIETLNAIKDEALSLKVGVDVLNTKLEEYEAVSLEDIPIEVNDAWTNLHLNLDIIITWVNQAIEAIGDGTEEPNITIMQQFLAELKVVFDKYAAVIERLDPEGYGSSYGGASVFRLTATLDGVTETKDVVSVESDKLQSTDLVYTDV